MGQLTMPGTLRALGAPPSRALLPPEALLPFDEANARPPLKPWQVQAGQAFDAAIDGFLGALGLAPTGETKANLVGQLLSAAAPVVGGVKALGVQTLEDLGRRIANPIKAYHGSPHDFDQFSLSKIGTGEGAQAYGYGLYFADNENVARSYRDQLSPIDINKRADGAPVSHDLQRMVGDSWQKLHGRTRSKPTIQAALDDVDESLMRQRADAMKARDQEWFNKIEDLRLEAQRMREAPPAQSGRMYEVNIHADPEDFLDWDAPLSQQSEKVDSVLRQLGITKEQALAEVPKLDALAERALADGVNSPAAQAFDAHMKSPAYRLGKALSDSTKPPNTWGYTPADKTTGMEVVRALGDSHRDKLTQAGIPGIKYLDGASRAAGQGSRNYVVFDDRLIEIRRKFGLAGLVSAGLLSPEIAKGIQDGSIDVREQERQ